MRRRKKKYKTKTNSSIRREGTRGQDEGELEHVEEELLKQKKTNSGTRRRATAHEKDELEHTKKRNYCTSIRPTPRPTRSTI